VTAETPWVFRKNVGFEGYLSWHESEMFAKYRKPGHVVFPYWLQPERHYLGQAWFQREVVIPQDWVGKRVVLHLERCHWKTQVWVDGNEAGFQDSLATPHRAQFRNRWQEVR
jgi:hypothetical protein